jgi:tRNA modification GTPase
VRLIDTAGIRTASDEAESIGVRKTMEAMADADVVLVVVDASTRADFGGLIPMDQSFGEHLLTILEDRRPLVVWNKIDLAPPRRHLPHGEPVPGLPLANLTLVVPLGANVGADGRRNRRASQEDSGIGSWQPNAQRESGFLTNVRQKQLVADAISALEKAAAAVPQKIPHEMLLLDLYSALRALDEITGATTADDILNLIFSSFCIGK